MTTELLAADVSFTTTTRRLSVKFHSFNHTLSISGSTAMRNPQKFYWICPCLSYPKNQHPWPNYHHHLPLFFQKPLLSTYPAQIHLSSNVSSNFSPKFQFQLSAQFFNFIYCAFPPQTRLHPTSVFISYHHIRLLMITNAAFAKDYHWWWWW